MYKQIRIIFVSVCLVLLLQGCGDGGGGNGSSGGFGGLDNEDLGGHGADINYVHVDLADAQALVTMQTSDSIVSSGITVPSGLLAKAVSDEKPPLFKIDSTGEVDEAIRNFSSESTDSFSSDSSTGLDTEAVKRLPHISYLAVNACNEVFVVFEHPFIFRETALVQGVSVSINDYNDPWSSSSPFTCQFFKVNQTLADYTATDQIKQSNLECITASLELNTWDPRAGQIQFDNSCNVYFTAHVPGNWKNVLIKREYASGTLSEVINANICFRDYLVTSLGGVLYTGQTSTDGSCNGSSFFRYVTPASALKEVVRDWWEYTFKPIVSGADSGKLLFYGPSTLTSTVPSWDSACLYKFDPDVEDDESTTSTDERSTTMADCQDDIWRYVNDASLTGTQRKTRCEEDKYVLGSGQSPENILLSDVNGDSTDDIILVTDVRHKLAGTWVCSLCMQNGGQYCTEGIDGNGQITSIGAPCGATETSETGNECFNDVTTTAVCESTNANVNVNYKDCRQPGNNWTEEIGGMVRVNADTTITLLSSTGESVINAWTINNVLYYSSYSTGIHRLKKVTFNSQGNPTLTTLLSNIEIYKLTQDPIDSTKLFINGLNFSNNAFVAGSFDPDASVPQDTLASSTQLTGIINTMLIIDR